AETDVVVFMDVDKPTLKKDTRGTRREYSRYKSSERQALNPAYLDAQAVVQQKQMEQMRAESGGGLSFSLDPIALVAGLAKEAYTQAKTMVAKTNLKAAQDTLANTPRMLPEGGTLLSTALGVVKGDVATQPIAALPQDIERGAVAAPLALALGAPGSCDVYFDSFVDQLKFGRCAAEAENLKGLAEAIGGASRGVADTGIITTARTPDI